MIRLDKNEREILRLERLVEQANARWLHAIEERNAAEAIVEKQKSEIAALIEGLRALGAPVNV